MQTEEHIEGEIIRLAHMIAEDSNKLKDATHREYLRSQCVALAQLLGDNS